MPESLIVRLKQLLPNTFLSQLAGWLAQCEQRWLSRRLIQYFLSRYAVDLNEAVEPNPDNYASFNAFFTRALRDDARPLASANWLCPVDGGISQLGTIEHDQIFQAKGKTYSTTQLLDDAKLAQHFAHGKFCTLYLSPKDYHRVHMPHDAKLISMRYIPGRLLSVNPANARHIAALFARNERVVCEFVSETGRFIMVLVGATLVGSIATVWEGVINATHQQQSWSKTYDPPLAVQKGKEMGRFLLGSTVILLFPPDAAIQFPSDWHAERPVRLGEAMSAVPRQSQYVCATQ